MTEKNKDLNRFRFKSFSERISEIDIRQTALYRIGIENENVLQENETYFHQTIRKWTVLNLTAEFSDFSRRFYNVISLPQLLHQKDIIIDILLEKLSTSTTLFLQPLLEILVSLSKDLSEYFCNTEHFQRIFDCLISLLNTQNVEQLEWTLICLAYLFKTLKTFLKRYVSFIFHLVIPLFDEEQWPDHIRNFAVECLAYIARDVVNQKKLLEVFIKNIEKQGRGIIKGCGKLFFEIIRGVNKDFHSVAQKLLPLLLESLLSDITPINDILTEIVKEMVHHILNFVNTSNMSIIWDSIFTVVEKILATDEQNENIIRLIQIIGICIEHKSGEYLISPNLLANVVLQIFDSYNSSEVVLTQLNKILCCLLLSNCNITQFDLNRMCKKILTVPYRSVYENFIWNMKSHPQFELFMLPSFLKFIESNFDIHSLTFLTKVVLFKAPLCEDGRKYIDWKKYPIKLNNTGRILNVVECKKEDECKVELYLLVSIVAPHLENIKVQSDIKNYIESEINKILQTFDEIELDSNIQKQTIVLAVFVENLFHLNLKIENILLQNIINTIITFCGKEKFISCLKLLNLICVYCNSNCKELLTYDLFTKIHKVISNNLSSPLMDFRSLTAHTLNQFYNAQNLITNDVYQVFYKIECTETTIYTYREKIILINKLLPNGVYMKHLVKTYVILDCLKFLLGLLYHNFKLLWEPIFEVTQNLVNCLSLTSEFCEIYKSKLETTAKIINEEIADPTLVVFSGKTFSSEILQQIFENAIDYKVKVDYRNYRNLLWSKLPTYKQLVEIKNRDIVTIFLNFFNQEYKVLKKRDTTWDLLETCNKNNDKDCLKVPEKNVKQLTQYNKTFKNTVQTLVIKLNVFKNQDNPKQLHRQKELYQVYLELLMCSNTLLQKLALDCLMAYKNTYLIMYKDHLYNFVDEEKFKDEILTFKINAESPEKEIKFSPEFVNILMRILHGKINSKVAGTNKNKQVRKAQILQFLANFAKDDKFWFLQLFLKDYGNVFENDLENMVAHIDVEFNLKSVLSAKIFKSTLNLIALTYKSFIGLMDTDFLTYMFNIMIYIGYTCEKVLRNSDKIQNIKFLIMYKNVKIIALEGITNFFAHFKNFDWEENQIKTINEIFICPSIRKLAYESIHNPTPLLKLLCIWSQNKRYFSYFLIESEEGLVAFKFVIDLLLNEKARPIIRKTILEMIERLLLSCYNEYDEFDVNSFGAAVIRPHIHQILRRLQNSLCLKKCKNKVNKRDMNIISSLTYFVQDLEICNNITEIFLPILLAKTKIANKETQQYTIAAVCNLIKNSSNSVDYLKKICVLFVDTKVIGLRKQLCELLCVISEKYISTLPHMIELAKVINELNAWDKRWVEQPDYCKRISAIKCLIGILNSRKINLDFGIIVACNCFHFLKYDSDVGLRENSSELLKILVPKLLKDNQHLNEDVDYIINEVFFEIIKNLLRDNNDVARNEGILILREMAKECYMLNPILRNLCHLVDYKDEETDFFVNISHLQSQRHIKAWQRFSNITKNLNEPFYVKTLTNFLLPLTSKYLLNEKYSNKNALIDAVLESVGIICKLLPWKQYEMLLKYYLRKLRTSNEHQKQTVRIVVTILDSFHFDLSNTSDSEKIIDNYNCTTENQDQLKISKENTEQSADFIRETLAIQSQLKYVENKNLEKKSSFPTSVTILKTSSAKRILNNISSIIIPTLNNSINEKSIHDSRHKLNRKRYSIEREEEEIHKVPIALALIKLLQKLPKNYLEDNLPGVFAKVCTFLKSPLKSVRMLTRDILKKIMLSLGSKYLPLLIEQLRTLLTRGFQIHVLSVTLHGVLDILKEKFEPGHIELCLQDILEIILNDIFSEFIDQKEINKIAAHTPEAKPSSKSYLSLHIAARNIPESCLLDILIPFKEYLAQNISQKSVAKIEVCFQKIIIGLAENTLISKESLLFFIYGAVSEQIAELLPSSQNQQLTEKEKNYVTRNFSDCFLVPESPNSNFSMLHKNVKNNAQANAHVLIQFGLELLNIILKRNKISNISYEPYLNPIIPILNNSLKSNYIKVTTLALKCLTSIWNKNYKIEKCNLEINNILEQIFKILHKYSACGATRNDDSFCLVKNALKTIVALLRNVAKIDMTSTQIGQLLFYIERYILETERQPAAINLLKAMVFRKIQHKKLHNVMKNLPKITIISPSIFLQDEIRSLLIQYLIEYSKEKECEKIIKFFAIQLNYETSIGRMSAVKFIDLAIRKLPYDFLLKKSEFLYLQLGTRLVNEEMPSCIAAVAECIEILIARVDKHIKQRLFDITLMFLNNDKKPAVREMAATLLSRFISVEKTSFLPRINILFPILVTFLNSNTFKQPGHSAIMSISKKSVVNRESFSLDEKNIYIRKEKEKATDHELIQIQNCILKILEFFSDSILVHAEWNESIDKLIFECQNLLGYEHEWVRLNAVKIIRHIFSHIDYELVTNILTKKTKINESDISFLYVTPENSIKNLTLDLCAQMVPGKTSELLAEEITNIFLIFANILKAVQLMSNAKNTTATYNESHTRCKLNLNWLLRRMRYIVQAEISKAPHSFILRKFVFNFYEGLITILDVNIIQELAVSILSPLVREMVEDDQNIHPELNQQSCRIGSRLRKKIGSVVYDKLRAELQTKLLLKRTLRKKEIAIAKVLNPIKAVKRKKSVLKKKEISKKRKIDVIKGKVAGKKRKRKNDELF